MKTSWGLRLALAEGVGSFLIPRFNLMNPVPPLIGQVYRHSRVARFGTKLGQIRPKWDTSRTFFRSDSVQFGSVSQNVLNLIWKKSRNCPILADHTIIGPKSGEGEVYRHLCIPLPDRMTQWNSDLVTYWPTNQACLSRWHRERIFLLANLFMNKSGSPKSR